MKTIRAFAAAHKGASALIAVALIASVYKAATYSATASTETRYVLAQASTGTIIQTVTGSGQVSASNTYDLAPKASGEVTSINVVEGQSVKAGTLIATIDDTSALQSLANAKSNLQGAQISLAKLLEPTATTTVLQTKDSVSQAAQSLQNDQNNLSKAYDSGFTSVSNAFTDLPNVMTSIHNVLYTYNAGAGGQSQWNIDYYTNQSLQYDSSATLLESLVNQRYQQALTAYNQNFADYRSTDRHAATSTIAALIDETYETTRVVSDALKSANDLVQFYVTTLNNQNHSPVALASSNISTLNSLTSTNNGHMTDLSNARDSITNYQQAIQNDQSSLAIAQASLDKLQAGVDPLDVQSEQLSIAQAEQSVATAQENLADYYVYAPADGIISKVDVQKGDNASSGSPVATLLTTEQVADIALNEVDAAKVSVGQKATLTFDAIDGLSIAGTVSQVDTQGTVSQGVVTYTVTIAFSTSDSRVKPGMTANASIITASKSGVIVVPTAAVKTQGGASYAQVLDVGSLSASEALSSQGVTSATGPESVPVTTGLSNDTSIEVDSGLSDGQYVVIRTIAGSSGAAKTTASATSLFGGNRSAGAAVRTLTH